MKTRLGFVSNSSSTSFTCDVCGGTEGGWDSMSPEEMGFSLCEHGHEYHIDCVPKPNTDNLPKEILDKVIQSAVTCLKDYLVDYNSRKSASAYKDRIKSCSSMLEKLEAVQTKMNNDKKFKFEKYYDQLKVIEEESNEILLWEDGEPWFVCPICTMSTISQTNRTEYINKKYHIDLETIDQEIKDSFSTLEEFETFLKE